MQGYRLSSLLLTRLGIPSVTTWSLDVPLGFWNRSLSLHLYTYPLFFWSIVSASRLECRQNSPQSGNGSQIATMRPVTAPQSPFSSLITWKYKPLIKIRTQLHTRRSCFMWFVEGLREFGLFIYFSLRQLLELFVEQFFSTKKCVLWRKVLGFRMVEGKINVMGIDNHSVAFSHLTWVFLGEIKISVFD